MLQSVPGLGGVLESDEIGGEPRAVPCPPRAPIEARIVSIILFFTRSVTRPPAGCVLTGARRVAFSFAWCVWYVHVALELMGM